MEEKIQSVQYRDSEPSEFAHKPPKQEMDLSCSPGRLSPIGRSHRLDSVELGVIHIVASSFSVLVAFAHVIEVFMAPITTRRKRSKWGLGKICFVNMSAT